MEIEFDAAKDQDNIAKHGVSLALAAEFDPETLITRIDNRKDYGEMREIGLGLIDDRLHVVVFTRRANARRIISLRKANKRETEMFNVTQEN